jgi:hypothetical protein
MQKKPRRRSGERLLEDALAALSRALSEVGAPWMIIGGIAIIARGVRRFTTDIDAAVRGDAIHSDELVATLEKHEIVPRIEDALSFAQTNLVLLARHAPTGVDLDISFAWSAFEHDALAACTPTRFGRVRVPLCLPEHLVVFKAIAGRPKDMEDAEALLALYPDIDIARVRRRVAELAALADAPEVLEAFDAIARRCSPSRRRPKMIPRRKAPQHHGKKKKARSARRH